MIRRLLLRFHKWLGIKLKIPIHVCPVPPVHICPPSPPLPDNIMVIEPKILEILPDIISMANDQESIQDVSGEYKRHQVYAQAIKKYPDINQMDLSLGIEIAIQKIKGDSHGK